MLGANLVAALVYLHTAKALSTRIHALTKLLILVSGCALFLLTLTVCFTGYVLVAGQMSY